MTFRVTASARRWERSKNARQDDADTQSDTASIAPGGASSIIAPGDVESIIAPDDASSIVAPGDAESNIAPDDAASTIAPDDAPSIIAPDDASFIAPDDALLKIMGLFRGDWGTQYLADVQKEFREEDVWEFMVRKLRSRLCRSSVGWVGCSFQQCTSVLIALVWSCACVVQ